MPAEFKAVKAIKETKWPDGRSKALLCVISDKETRWIPQSVITDDSEVYSDGDEGTLVITDWFAEKEGLA